MGCGGADVCENANVSGDDGLCGGGEDGLGGGGARWLMCYRFPRVCGELWFVESSGRAKKVEDLFSIDDILVVFGRVLNKTSLLAVISISYSVLGFMSLISSNNF